MMLEFGFIDPMFGFGKVCASFKICESLAATLVDRLAIDGELPRTGMI